MLQFLYNETQIQLLANHLLRFLQTCYQNKLTPKLPTEVRKFQIRKLTREKEKKPLI
jgi:hypothetical protein